MSRRVVITGAGVVWSIGDSFTQFTAGESRTPMLRPFSVSLVRAPNLLRAIRGSEPVKRWDVWWPISRRGSVGRHQYRATANEG